MDDFSAWIGRSESAEDSLSPAVIARLAAVLDHPAPLWPAGEAPPLAHWLCFLPDTPQSGLGRDGHARLGGFLPPVPLPRRMWAGGRFEFHAPLPVGPVLRRRSTIAGIRAKSGASGPLLFVTIRHEVFAGEALLVTEEQDLVYREESGPTVAGAPAPPPPDRAPADASRIVVPDPVMLFRYSALTFNGHRIHYDRDYARDVEGYAGLVVHGPLLATLLLDHYRGYRPDRWITRFSFRAQRPLIDTAPFELCVAGADTAARLWIRDVQGYVTMTAELATA